MRIRDWSSDVCSSYLGDIAQIGIAPKVWVTLLQSLGEQSLVDANIGKTGLHRLLIEGIDELFVIEPPRFGQIFVRVVADGIAFEGVRPKRNVAVDCVEPARCARLDDGVDHCAA